MRSKKKLTVSQPLILILEKIDYDFRTIFLVPFLLHSLFLRQKKKKKSMAVKSFIRRSSARNLTRSVKKLAIPIVGETKLQESINVCRPWRNIKYKAKIGRGRNLVVKLQSQKIVEQLAVNSIRFHFLTILEENKRFDTSKFNGRRRK